MLQLHLMHGQRLNLSLKNVHSLCSHHRADIRNHSIGEDFVDQAMITRESCVRNVFERIAIVLVLFIFRRLNINTTILLAATTTLGAGPGILVPIAVSTRLLLVLCSQIGQISRRSVVCLQVLLVFKLFCFVLRDKFLLVTFGQITPLLADNLANFPQFQIRVGCLDRVPNLPRVSHVRHQGLFRCLRRL